MNVLQSLFSPLGKEYCIWFYYLSVIGYTFFIVGLLSALIYGVKTNKPFSYYLGSLFAGLAYFVMYFQNRLLYSMCMN